jgi:6-phosphofructokinase 1
MKTPLSSPERPKTEVRRVAILFSGGPAPAANAVIASAAMCFSRAGIEVLGLLNGYSHLAKYKPSDPLKEGTAYVRLDHRSLEGTRNHPGIMIGTSRANPGKALKTPADLENPEKTAPLKVVYDALRSLEVDALVSIGGDDTLTTAAKFKLFQDRLPEGHQRIKIVHLPKTIDNDYKGIDFTFGYFTAVEMLAQQCYNLLCDSRATGTYYVAQVMGRAAGWLAYGAAIAGEASLVIGLEDIAEAWWTHEPAVDPKTDQPMTDKDGKPVLRRVVRVEPMVRRIVDTILARDRDGKNFGVIVLAEGIAEFLPQNVIRECLSESAYKGLEVDTFGHFPVSQLKYSGDLGRLVADEYKRRTGKDRKVVGLQFGYEVRCHKPTAFDVMLGSQLGVGAYRAIAERNLTGVMVSVTGQLRPVFEPFERLIDYQRLRAFQRPIDPGEGFHQLARYLEVRVDDSE